MNINEIKSDGLKQEFKLTIPYSHYDKKHTEELLKVGTTSKIAGFRPGKAPLQLLKQRFGNRVTSDVLENVIEEGVKHLIQEKNLKPALKPKVSLEHFAEGQDIEIKIDVETLPVIKTVDLKSLSFERMICEFPEHKLSENFDKLRQRSRNPGEIKDQAAENGDAVIIDFVGHLENGTKIDGGSGEGATLELGSGTFIPGFEEQLIGAKSGDKVSVRVPFPQNYHEAKLAGKNAIFDVHVREIRGVEMPELSEDFATNIGFKDVAELQDFMRQQVQKDCDMMTRLIAKRHILDQFAEKMHFEVPQGLVELEFNTIWQQFLEHQTKAISTGQLEKMPSDEEQEKEKQQYRDIAERRVRLGLLLADIGQHHHVVVTQRELENALQQTMRRYPGQERQIYDYFRNNQTALANLRAPIFEDKVIDLILEKANLTDNVVSYKALEDQVRELTEDDDTLDQKAFHQEGDGFSVFDHEDDHVHGPDCHHDVEDDHVHGPDCQHDHT